MQKISCWNRNKLGKSLDDAAACSYRKRMVIYAVGFGCAITFAGISLLEYKMIFAGVASAVLGYLAYGGVLAFADEVFDCDNHILVKFKRKQVEIPLENIININRQGYEITLHLRESCIFGDKIIFYMYEKDLIENIITRMDSLKQHSETKVDEELPEQEPQEISEWPFGSRLAVPRLFILPLSLYILFLLWNQEWGASISFFVIMIAACAVFYRTHFSKIDAVYDCGNHLLVKFGKEADRISFSNITNVHFEKRDVHITLQLREKCKFGDKINFRAKLKGPFSKNDIAEKIIHKIDKVRR